MLIHIYTSSSSFYFHPSSTLQDATLTISEGRCASSRSQRAIVDRMGRARSTGDTRSHITELPQRFVQYISYEGTSGKVEYSQPRRRCSSTSTRRRNKRSDRSKSQDYPATVQGMLITEDVRSRRRLVDIWSITRSNIRVHRLRFWRRQHTGSCDRPKILVCSAGMGTTGTLFHQALCLFWTISLATMDYSHLQSS